MMIHSPSHTYPILGCLRGEGHWLVAGGVARRLLVRVEPPARWMPLFLHFMDGKTFADLVEVFPYEDAFYAVFKHPDEGTSVYERLPAATSGQRAALLRGLFKKLLQSAPPDLVLCDVLRPENLVCDSAGEVAFIYALRPRNGDAAHVRRSASAALITAARDICGGAPLASIDALFSGLGNHCDHAALYRLALTAADELAEYRPPEPVKRSLRARLNAAMETVKAKVAPVAVVLAFLAGFVAMGLLFYHNVIAPPPVDNGIEVIGTVTLRGDGDGE